jgi:hypothetical protein
MLLKINYLAYFLGKGRASGKFRRSGDIDENKGQEIWISEGPAIFMKTRDIGTLSGDVDEK